MNEIVKILVKRDNMSEEDAKCLVQETIDEILCNPDEADEIINDYLGLEPDYLEYLF